MGNFLLLLPIFGAFIFLCKMFETFGNPIRFTIRKWGFSSVGRAQRWQRWGQEFESPKLHHLPTGWG